MDAQAPHVRVTYLNPMNGERFTLIDDVDVDTATRVIGRFGDEDHRAYYLPGLIIETM
jgi:hypothetical protein